MVYSEENGYDVVVVGSGYGGAVAACRLSMAGLKVCLVEKGRRWEAQDFPTNSFQFLRNCKYENRRYGISYGENDALFQVHQQKDCVAFFGCGLGGGSLINAGVIVPTPVRTRRNKRWPKEWERDWELNQASASEILRAQSLPKHKFPNGKVMENTIGDDDEFEENSELKLSVNFDADEQSSKNSAKMDACLGCGNCVSGCPYNAKTSTDKNYIYTAIQEGCTVKTECQVQHVVNNSGNFSNGEDISKKRRRWLVFFDEVDYVECDFIVLSAGVFGTTKILFQSQMRGLKVSDMLGSGVSCNGNNCAYVTGSPAPLSASGLDRNHLQFSKTPFQDRPGPSISSSYTNSLGFTIQGAVLATSYTPLLFKGIVTYGWPPGYGFLHGIIDKLKLLLGMKNSQGIVLNVMGYDEGDGKITFEKETNKLSIEPPKDTLVLPKMKALQKLSKKLGGILYMSRYRSTSVHLLGGCNASSDHTLGVCNTNGQVFDTEFDDSVHAGLYVCDASLIPCAVGINPCLTIATASEHVSKHLVRDVLRYKDNIRVMDTTFNKKSGSVIFEKLDASQRSSTTFTETMRGHIGGMPVTAHLKLRMNSKTSKDHDKMSINISESHSLLRGKVGGHVVFKEIETDKLHVIDGEVDMCKVDNRSPYTQYMHYRLLLAASSGSRYILEGKKVMNPFLFGLYILKESTELHVTFKKLTEDSTDDKESVYLRGSLHISMNELLRSLISMKGNNKVKFISLLLKSFLRTYILQNPRGINKNFTSPEVYERPYPSSNLLKIKTEDGFIISCKQWKYNENILGSDGEKKLHPVLLINGYATESYFLPSEPNDMIRTLLAQGYETWLLQPRLHNSNYSNNFSVEDIGRYDIPAAINKMLELNAGSTKVHVVAHCVGGVALHIAIMGGHISASHTASLSCTNSSMFFKLTPFASFKMRLPLLPITMLILGKNKTLPILGTLKTTSAQRFLRAIARLIPRSERCTCDECEVFSGIFGNAFWHNNITSSMHEWLNKVSLPKLPMAAFPHLRKICNSGFIVNTNGENTYLIHPERMALSTLYISGGKTILVTPETSFLANKYMKLHQPSYRHDRIVVDRFGHSDLFIGEESHKKVYPHILSHIELAEKGRILSTVNNSKEMKHYNNEALAWGDDPYDEEVKAGFGSWIFPLIYLFFFLLFLILVVA